MPTFQCEAKDSAASRDVCSFRRSVSDGCPGRMDTIVDQRGWLRTSLSNCRCGERESRPSIRCWILPSRLHPSCRRFRSRGTTSSRRNPATFIKLRGNVLWSWSGGAVAAGGDTDDNVNLRPYVTPVSPVASTFLNVSGSIVSSTHADFTINWSGSDRGTAQELTWYQYTGTIPPGFTGDNTQLPNWSSESTLLESILRVGPWNETLTVDITGVNVNQIILATSGIATSIPEPASLLLLGIGAVGTLGYAWLRRSRRPEPNPSTRFYI